MINRYLCFAALYLATAVVYAAPSVSGNTISWPDDGWYQVQRSSDYTTQCNGGSSCVVEPGTYKVINHSTGEIFRNIVVGEPSTEGSPISVMGNVISWPDGGWYQVQRSSDYATLCNGGSSCEVEPGFYKVINHTTGEIFRNINVGVQHIEGTPISVVGNVILWPDNGWYQVQRSSDYATLCNGGSSCFVQPGTYKVINHTTGEQFKGIEVNAPSAVQASLELVADKTFHISWQPFEGAQFYRVFENSDGVSGFSQISEDLKPSAHTFDHRVALYSKINARYLVQACNASGCVDSLEQIVVGTLEHAIGYFKASNTDLGDNLGWSISLSADGNTMAIRAAGESSVATGINGNQNDNSAEFSGAVYVFARINGIWEQQGYLKASNTGEFDNFGEAVSLSADGNTLAIGAFGEGSNAAGVNGNQLDNSAYASGAVYMFARVNGIWQQQAYLKASNPEIQNFFGHTVSLSADGSTLAVGARGEKSAATGIDGNQDDNSAAYSGAVYVFAHINGIWQQQAYLKASNAQAYDTFGEAVSLSADGNTLAVGAPQEGSAATGVNGNQDDNSAYRSGAAYLFTRANSIWQQHAYLKASNTDIEHWFGWSISLSADGNTLAVGARYEDSAATGINGNQNDNSAYRSGAAYVFTRGNGVWQQQAYLKASNTDMGHLFGWSISLSADGNTLSVGARFEDSATIGINGNQYDNSAHRSGAAYLFTRSDGVWQQRAYLKASNTQAYDEFGSAVSLSADGKTLAVGARGEQSAATGINGNQGDNSAKVSGAVYLY